MITIGSLFDGSGGFPLAGALSGAIPIWASEVEPYPIAVTRSRFPQMKHLGSVTEVHGGEIEPVDVITFGSPCQDLSVAGKRAGIHDGQRSNLFFEAIRIIREMREKTNGRHPTFAVWENVPGAFSSNKGEDFRCVLEEFVHVCDEKLSVPRPANGRWNPAGEIVGDGYSIAWRQLDAQFWGVPQRRKRIYLVADFRDQRAGEILFERESLRGYSAPSGAPGQGTADDAAGSTGGSSGVRCLNPWDCQSKRIYEPNGAFPTLPAMGDGGANNQAVLYEPHSALDENWAKASVKNAIRASASKSSHVVVEPIYTLQGNGIDRADTAGCNGKGWREDVSYTLNTIDRPAICFHLQQDPISSEISPCLGGQGQATVGVFMGGQGAKASGIGYSKSVSPTLKSVPSGSNTVPTLVYDARGNGDGAHCPTLTGDHENRVTDYTAVCCMEYGQSRTAYAVDCRNAALDEGKTHTLQAKASGGQSVNCTPSVLTQGKPPRKYIIRRLTPLECCRLQGFPDGWGVPDHKTELTDAEATFWENARKTHAEINGKQYRPCKSRAALTKWYNALHTDSAEYKMWGNGIALPCAFYVVSGCVEALTS